jgi:hypothetical protein
MAQKINSDTGRLTRLLQGWDNNKKNNDKPPQTTLHKLSRSLRLHRQLPQSASLEIRRGQP